MRLLELEWVDTHFRYTQVERDSSFAIYTQTNKASGTVRYEAIKILHRPANTWPNGIVTPAHEAYPTSRQWGDFGWTFFTLAAAEEKFHELSTTRSQT